MNEPQEPQEQQVQINIKDAENVCCEECEGDRFVPTFLIKKVSALMSPTGKEIMAPIQLFQCAKCSHINKNFLE